MANDVQSYVTLSRRALVLGMASAIAGCSNVRQSVRPVQTFKQQSITDPRYESIIDHGIEIHALDLSKINPSLLRDNVPFETPFPVGAIIIDIDSRRLYLVEHDNRAIRYSVGVGREEALNFNGRAVVGRKEVWPRWTPTRDMIERMPRYAAYAGGLPGGIENPLGARALYLYRNGADTHFRIHGTNEPATIGSAVSSGCIRLFNHDIIDLFSRVEAGAAVDVFQNGIAQSA
jgi:lipoprotein-anchoring transpeptidase ErfK/SrfK